MAVTLFAMTRMIFVEFEKPQNARVFLYTKKTVV
jgi:hypothetical protein